MHTDNLENYIGEAFGGLHPPSFKEMAAINCSIEDRFLSAVEFKEWQELRPLREYISDSRELAAFSAKAYQYYLPAFLYTLVHDADYDRYLSGLLNSLWYDNWRVVIGSAKERYQVPPGGWEELLPEIEKQMPFLSYEERKAAAESRVSIANKLAKVTAMTGRDWADMSHHRKLWEERMAVLTYQQKRCIALSLVHILEGSPHPTHASRIQSTLDNYWRTFLTEAGGR